jgi:hypothetical protein
MTEVERLRAQADRCFGLAQRAVARDAAESMYNLAAEYLEEAKALERAASKQSGDQRAPRPPSSDSESG